MTYGWMDENFIRNDQKRGIAMKMGFLKMKRNKKGEIKVLSRDYYFSICLDFYVRVSYPVITTANCSRKREKSKSTGKEREGSREDVKK